MKRIVLLSLALLIIYPAFSQDWKTVVIDSTISVKVPYLKTVKKDKDYDLATETSFGKIFIFKTADDSKITPDIERDKHLMKYYKQYISIISKSSKGKILDIKDGLIGQLKVKDFTLETDTGTGVLYRSFRILHANNYTYTFEFLYEGVQKEYALPEREQFFKSISVNEELDMKDQYTSAALNTANGNGNNKIWMIAGSVALVLLVLYFIFRSRKVSRT
jgi:hypothetical protein